MLVRSLPRRDPDSVDLSARFSRRLTLRRPIVSANMDTVTRAAMAIVLAEEGGLGIIDRGFRAGDIGPQVAEIATVKRTQHGVIGDPHAIDAGASVAEARRLMTRTRVGTLASASPTRPFDDKRFDLIITLDPTTVDLRPEMTIRADVIIGTRTNVLMMPVSAVFNNQGTRVAYVVGTAGLEMRPIALGEASDRMVEVAGGLKEGERVSLVGPAAATPSGSPLGNALQPR